MERDEEISKLMAQARRLEAAGQDDQAKTSYFEVLRLDPTHFPALNELGNLAMANGFRSAALTAYGQAVRFHPNNLVGRVNLGNGYYQSGELEAAREQYEAALATDKGCAEAHQGLGRILDALGDAKAAEEHFRKGFLGNAVVVRRYRGAGRAIRVLLLVSVKSGNVPTRHILDDRIFEVVILHAEYFGPEDELPSHDVVFNAIGDADQCSYVLKRAENLLSRTRAPVINPPESVRVTGRAENARRIAGLAGVVVPLIREVARSELGNVQGLSYPFLVRAPGFHTGSHFLLVERPEDLASTASFPRETVLLIEYLNARSADGMARKYRVMFIDGRIYPLHLAVSSHWKVHYFTADMASNPLHREEERRFLEGMETVLGPRIMRTLERICQRLALDYGGIDFGIGPDGSLLLFETNATMVIVPPAADPMWDYRRAPINQAIEAARRLVLERVSRARPGRA